MYAPIWNRYIDAVPFNVEEKSYRIQPHGWVTKSANLMRFGIGSPVCVWNRYTQRWESGLVGQSFREQYF